MEDYKQKYENALEKARVWKEKSGMPIDRQGILDDIFPELKESEDKIMKELILNVLLSTTPQLEEILSIYKKRRGDVIAWLEKQGEASDYNPYKETVKSISIMVEKYAQLGSDLQDFYDNVKVKCKNAIEYDRIFIEKQGEQKSTDKVEPKFKVGDTIVGKDLDEYDYETIKDIKNGQYIFTDGYSMNIDVQEEWQLVKTPTIIEQKLAWSVEDESMLQNILECLKNGWSKLPTDILKYESWLKSLKERMKGE